ncbi:MAG TPA: hypothetical protein VFK21_11330 [Gammaproteobacteria bacterium]|nr:hypothetical protein [Gammaproteobacteria bacterium]
MTASLIPLFVVQWLHVIGGLVWAGGALVGGYLLPRAMVDKPAPAGRAVYDPFIKTAGPLMEAAGITVLLAGLLRGTLFGPVHSFAIAFGTAYGLTWITALLFSMVFAGHSGHWHKRMPELIWNEELKGAEAKRLIDRHGLVSLVLFLGIIACMVLMRLGL